jgi:hypothetical protein
MRTKLTQVRCSAISGVGSGPGERVVGPVGDKSPKKDNAKKPSKSLKEKRADKQSKRDEKRS